MVVVVFIYFSLGTLKNKAAVIEINVCIQQAGVCLWASERVRSVGVVK